MTVALVNGTDLFYIEVGRGIRVPRHQGERMTCRTVIEFLAEYLSGELLDHQRVAFDAHLAECSACVAYLKSYERTVALGKDAFADPDAPVPTEVPDELVKAILAARTKRK